MSAAASKGLWLSEETLTEWVQYNIALAHQGADIVVDLATKPKESLHGGDWEWWFARGRKAIGFRVQAKRLFRGGNYNSLFKSGSKPYEQLDKLVGQAAKDKVTPLYCFYNFAHNPSQCSGMSNTCFHSYRQPSFWGCSIASPSEVKKTGSNELKTLRHYMSPWHTLVCGAAAADILEAVRGSSSVLGNPDALIPRALPERIRRLIAFGEERRRTEQDRGLGEAWSVVGQETAEDVSGVAVYRDVRE